MQIIRLIEWNRIKNSIERWKENVFKASFLQIIDHFLNSIIFTLMCLQNMKKQIQRSP